MDVKVFTHIRVLYIFVFGLYFGLFALMYCNFAIWWKVQNIKNYSSYIGCNEQIQLNNELSKENVAVQSKSRNKRSRSYRATIEECTRLANICQAQLSDMRGLKGEKGEPGMNGAKGEYGISGMRGPAGPPGPTGPQGKDGLKGDKGDDGHPGLLGFPGIKGKPGPPGDKGDQGDRGIIGPMGLKGDTGTKGHKGEKGIDGIPGKRGRRGDDGLKGEMGERGVDGPQGPQGFKGDKGEMGDKGDTGYGIQCNCPKGDKGDKGQRGLIGFTGYKGDKGNDGGKGDIGFGLRGLPGIPGKPGLKGEPGERGPKGECIVSSPLAMESWRINSDSPSVQVETDITSSVPDTTDWAVNKPLPTEQTTETTLIPTTTAALVSRKTERKLQMTGIPLYLRNIGPRIGCWMRDAVAPNNYYVTYGYYGQYVYQYFSLQNFENNKVDRTHDLRMYHYYGNSHMVHNGSLFYQRSGENNIVKFEFALGAITTHTAISGAAYNDSNYLYAGSHIYFDIEADENGLWVIYRKQSNESIFVAKIDPYDMQIIRTWTIKVNPTKIGNGFIANGIIYLIEDITTIESRINFAYDLFNGQEYKMKAPAFKNPYSFNTAINYFSQPMDRYSKLLSWDNGVQLEYALLFG